MELSQRMEMASDSICRLLLVIQDIWTSRILIIPPVHLGDSEWPAQVAKQIIRDEQEICGIFMWIGKCKSGLEAGRIVHIVLENFRLIIGYKRCIFHNPNKRVGLDYDFEDCYGFLHDFLELYRISVRLLMATYFQKKCVWNSLLMKSMGSN